MCVVRLSASVTQKSLFSRLPPGINRQEKHSSICSQIGARPVPPTGRGDRQADGAAAGGCFPRTLTCLLALSSAQSSSHGPADKHTPPFPPAINYSRRSQLDLNNSSCECQYLVNNVQKCPTWSSPQLALALCVSVLVCVIVKRPSFICGAGRIYSWHYRQSRSDPRSAVLSVLEGPLWASGSVSGHLTGCR